mmetsp:Transcript_20127/g.31473  ORF Transcript_20127/g.31473 Transcript_20127/m.31473 type:complete len:242 (+) Transcript_20127:111-836(+)
MSESASKEAIERNKRLRSQHFPHPVLQAQDEQPAASQTLRDDTSAENDAQAPFAKKVKSKAMEAGERHSTSSPSDSGSQGEDASKTDARARTDYKALYIHESERNSQLLHWIIQLQGHVKRHMLENGSRDLKFYSPSRAESGEQAGIADVGDHGRIVEKDRSPDEHHSQKESSPESSVSDGMPEHKDRLMPSTMSSSHLRDALAKRANAEAEEGSQPQSPKTPSTLVRDMRLSVFAFHTGA